MESIEGRVAVITGGASGIGLATGRALAARGARLVLADIEAERLDAVVAELEGQGVAVRGVVCDVASRESVEALAEATWSAFGACHILFNNAGVAVFGPTHEASHDDWRWTLDVDLWGPIHGVEAFVPRMIAGGEPGHVVNTASFAGLVANESLGPYCVAKFGVVALSECLRKDLRGHGIGVSVLCPMRVATDIDASDRNRTEAYGGPDAGHGTEDVPDEDELAGRLLGPDEVADLVVRGILANELYLVPHAEALDFVARRFERISRALTC